MAHAPSPKWPLKQPFASIARCHSITRSGSPAFAWVVVKGFTEPHHCSYGLLIRIFIPEPRAELASTIQDDAKMILFIFAEAVQGLTTLIDHNNGFTEYYSDIYASVNSFW